MHIRILANRDLHANYVVDRLLRALPEHRFSLVLSERVGRAEGLAPGLRALAHHEQRLLTDLLEPALGADDGRAPASAAPAVRTFRALHGVLEGRVQVVNRPRSAEGRALLLEDAPDLLISIRYGGILDAAHADAVPNGILNLHSGRLPDYRGILASLRAVLAGDRHLCCTLHRIVDSGIDTGPVLATAAVPCDFQRSLLWNIAALYVPGVDLVVRAVQQIAAGGTLRGTEQDPDAGDYFSLPDATDLARLDALGMPLVDLADSIELLRDRYLQTN